MPRVGRRYPVERVSRATHVVATVAVSLATVAALRADSDPLVAVHARIDALAKTVAAQRELRFKRKVARTVLDRAELQRRVRRAVDDPKARQLTLADGVALARWGLVPPDTDYPRLAGDLVSEQLTASYDAGADALTVERQALDEPGWTDLVLAHELGHALQDQTFDLEKLLASARDDDALLARRALVEGDAIALTVELALARQKQSPPWADPQLAASLARALIPARGDALANAPIAVRERVLFPYRAGLAFVAALRRESTWSAVDVAFKRPPRSTEHILHVEKYIADEKPLAVALTMPTLPASYVEVKRTVWGELGFLLFLRAHGVPDEMAEQAAEGWGGDSVLVVAPSNALRASRSIGVARLELDTEADAREAHAAAVRAIDSGLSGATAEHSDDRTRWLALDGTMSSVERQGSTLTIAVGIPAPLGRQALDELASGVRHLPQASK